MCAGYVPGRAEPISSPSRCGAVEWSLRKENSELARQLTSTVHSGFDIELGVEETFVGVATALHNAMHSNCPPDQSQS